MLRGCGGPERLAAEIVSLLQQSSPGSVTRRRLHHGILNAMSVLEASRRHRGRQEPVLDETVTAEMSDEQLLNAACEPLRRLQSLGLLDQALRHLMENGEIATSQEG